MTNTLSRGFDAIEGRLRQMSAIKDRTVLFIGSELDAGCDNPRRVLPHLNKRSYRAHCNGGPLNAGRRQ
jgi:hypothetical protein